METKISYVIVASVSAIFGVVVTAMVDRFALRTDVEFNSIVHDLVQDELQDLRNDLDEDI